MISFQEMYKREGAQLSTSGSIQWAIAKSSKIAG